MSTVKPLPPLRIITPEDGRPSQGANPGLAPAASDDRGRVSNPPVLPPSFSEASGAKLEDEASFPQTLAEVRGC